MVSDLLRQYASVLLFDLVPDAMLFISGPSPLQGGTTHPWACVVCDRRTIWTVLFQ